MKRKYRLKTEHVWAEKYKKGMEDGFSCIPYANTCTWKDESGNYKRCKKCPLNIRKKPYLFNYFTDKKTKAVKSVLEFISEGDYILTDSLERKFVCVASDFLNNYEPISNKR